MRLKRRKKTFPSGFSPSEPLLRMPSASACTTRPAQVLSSITSSISTWLEVSSRTQSWRSTSGVRMVRRMSCWNPASAPLVEAEKRKEHTPAHRTSFSWLASLSSLRSPCMMSSRHLTAVDMAFSAQLPRKKSPAGPSMSFTTSSVANALAITNSALPTTTLFCRLIISTQHTTSCSWNWDILSLVYSTAWRASARATDRSSLGTCTTAKKASCRRCRIARDTLVNTLSASDSVAA
mmetsp:Transcript_30006/g.77173  ORF Transcript_30006/g.77173 Transcript_30006/m.77173 type:complete len:236 (+) Transcript_30006:2669-3376(+)